MLADQDVFQHRELAEEADVLERPGHAVGGDDMRLLPADGLPLQGDLSGRRDVEAAEHVEDRRLAGTVRPDERLNFAPPDLHVHPVHRLETAKVLGQPLDCEQHLARSGAVVNV